MLIVSSPVLEGAHDWPPSVDLKSPRPTTPARSVRSRAQSGDTASAEISSHPSGRPPRDRLQVTPASLLTRSGPPNPPKTQQVPKASWAFQMPNKVLSWAQAGETTSARTAVAGG